MAGSGLGGGCGVGLGLGWGYGAAVGAHYIVVNPEFQSELSQKPSWQDRLGNLKRRLLPPKEDAPSPTAAGDAAAK